MLISSIKKLVITALLPALIFCSSAVMGQAGGFGQVYAGSFFVFLPDLGDHLMQDEVLDVHIPPTTAINFGGEVAGMRKLFILGAGGYMQSGPKFSTDSFSADFSSRFGYLKIGYRLFEETPNFTYVAMNFGLGSINLDIDNKMTREIKFDDDNPVPPGGTETYSQGLLLFEPTAGHKWVIPRNEDTTLRKGFFIGFDFGMSFKIPVASWETGNNETVDYPPGSTSMSPFVRLTIGGGRVSMH